MSRSIEIEGLQGSASAEGASVHMPGTVLETNVLPNGVVIEQLEPKRRVYSADRGMFVPAIRYYEDSGYLSRLTLVRKGNHGRVVSTIPYFDDQLAYETAILSFDGYETSANGERVVRRGQNGITVVNLFSILDGKEMSDEHESVVGRIAEEIGKNPEPDRSLRTALFDARRALGIRR